MTYEKEYTPPTVISDDVETNINIQKIWRNIYIWMALGLGAMSGLSYLYIKLPFINSFFINHAFFIFLGSLMIAFLLYMNFTFSSKMSAVSVFSSYTAFILLGSVLLFFIFLYYPSYIAIQTFASISLMFLCMVLPQSIFKHDLSVMSKVILMLISGLFTCFIVNYLYIRYKD